MNAIIDFNGFYNFGNEYVIKEYSIQLIRDDTNEEMDYFHRVSKPLTEWKALSKNDRGKYKDYFKTYGIAWKRGTHDHQFIIEELRDVLRNTKTIYLLHKGKRNMLANYLGEKLNFRFKYFKDMDFEFKPDLYTKCRYHEHPAKNNCANDNVSKMIEWFIARTTDFSRGNFNIVIDFNGWYFSDNEYMIKEYAMYFIHSKTNRVIFRDFQVSEAPVLWDQLDEHKRKEWKAYYRVHGIKWDYGSRDTESIKSNFIDKFSSSNKIYVRNRIKHSLLKKYLNYDFEASYLTDMNLELKGKMGTKCKNHDQRSKNNCANDNALSMISLLSRILEPPKLNIVIDFNGCKINDKYVVKEYSLYVVENETYDIIRNDFEVSRPPIKKDQLDKTSQEKCTDYTNEFGIDWDYGERDYKVIKKHIRREFRNSYKIYVISKTKYQLLRNYLDGKLRSNFVYLKKLGFEFKPKMRTTCSNHQEPLNTNCANDNVEEMLSWLLDNKPKANNAINIKLSGLKMPRFKRSIQPQDSNETKAEDNDSKRFKFNRGTELEVSGKTSSVPSRTTRKSALDRSLLPSPPPIPKSNSLASLAPSPPPMANAGSSAKPDISQTTVPAVTTVKNLLEKHIIVDFYGYDLPNNEYAIKEFNAIIVKKTSVLDKDLYLFVKPPFKDIKQLPSELTDAYFEFEQIHNIGWNDGRDDFSSVRSILISYFATATHIYVVNLEKQRLLEKFIDKNHNFIRLNELGFDDQPEKDSVECSNHFDEESVCARKFSKTMLQWVKKHALNHNSSRNDLHNDGGQIGSALNSIPPPPPMSKNISAANSIPPPPPMPKNVSAANSIPPPPPMPKNVSAANSIPPPPPMPKNVSAANSIPPPPLMPKNVSAANSIPPPPLMPKNVSAANSIPPPPPMPKNVSAANSIPPPPPMPKYLSAIKPVPIPPPMPKESKAKNSVAIPPAMPKSNSFAKQKFSNPNKEKLHFIDELHDLFEKRRLKTEK
ncbi:uncharacterized protein LOC141537308 [Cotesia typhae]|uniref:uncharacterized protein LOC141537308 n=1 Tax=Cotesia typhae TaxID=2053667 RepID=UPI003D690EC1